jgi:flagellar assembly protein FliH
MAAQAHTLSFRNPLREVRMVPLAPTGPMDRQLQEREEAACERGRAEAEKQFQEQLAQERKRFQELQAGVIESLQQCVPKVVRECERALAMLCLEAARKLVSDMPISAEMAEAAVREAMSQVDEATDYEVYLHAEDLQLMKAAGSPLLVQSANGLRVFFHASSEVTRGGCLVKTRFGIIDGRRETRFELLKKAVLS